MGRPYAGLSLLLIFLILAPTAAAMADSWTFSTQGVSGLGFSQVASYSIPSSYWNSLYQVGFVKDDHGNLYIINIQAVNNTHVTWHTAKVAFDGSSLTLINSTQYKGSSSSWGFSVGIANMYPYIWAVGKGTDTDDFISIHSFNIHTQYSGYGVNNVWQVLEVDWFNDEVIAGAGDYSYYSYGRTYDVYEDYINLRYGYFKYTYDNAYLYRLNLQTNTRVDFSLAGANQIGFYLKRVNGHLVPDILPDYADFSEEIPQLRSNKLHLQYLYRVYNASGTQFFLNPNTNSTYSPITSSDTIGVLNYHGGNFQSFPSSVYDFDVGDKWAIFRNSTATYVIPWAGQWYTASKIDGFSGNIMIILSEDDNGFYLADIDSYSAPTSITVYYISASAEDISLSISTSGTSVNKTLSSNKGGSADIKDYRNETLIWEKYTAPLPYNWTISNTAYNEYWTNGTTSFGSTFAFHYFIDSSGHIYNDQGVQITGLGSGSETNQTVTNGYQFSHDVTDGTNSDTVHLQLELTENSVQNTIWTEQGHNFTNHHYRNEVLIWSDGPHNQTSYAVGIRNHYYRHDVAVKVYLNATSTQWANFTYFTNDDGNTVYLYDSSGNLLAQYTYGSSTPSGTFGSFTSAWTNLANRVGLASEAAGILITVMIGLFVSIYTTKRTNKELLGVISFIGIIVVSFALGFFPLWAFLSILVLSILAVAYLFVNRGG